MDTVSDLTAAGVTLDYEESSGFDWGMLFIQLLPVIVLIGLFIFLFRGARGQTRQAFDFGRSKKDGRVCVTEALLQRLNREELEAVLAHEVSHLRHRDMVVITMLSVIPLICYFTFWTFLFGRGRQGTGSLIAIVAFALYLVTNLIVLYVSRIREYYADQGGAELTGKSHALASALYRILQYLADLNAFRDDCHVAAWRPYGVGGDAWEALTFVWRGEAHAAEELVEKLPFRGYDVADYTGTLEALAAKGWLAAGDDGAYKMTGEGEKVRQEAEDATDRWYYAVWETLGEGEVDEFGGLLRRLRDALNQGAG